MGDETETVLQLRKALHWTVFVLLLLIAMLALAAHGYLLYAESTYAGWKSNLARDLLPNIIVDILMICVGLLFLNWILGLLSRDKDAFAAKVGNVVFAKLLELPRPTNEDIRSKPTDMSIYVATSISQKSTVSMHDSDMNTVAPANERSKTSSPKRKKTV